MIGRALICLNEVTRHLNGLENPPAVAADHQSYIRLR
jgi:hypothetical protein